MKLSTLGVCCMCEASLKKTCKSHASSVQELCALCSTLIRGVCVAGNMNSTESKFKKLKKKVYVISCLTPSSPT